MPKPIISPTIHEITKAVGWAIAAIAMLLLINMDKFTESETMAQPRKYEVRRNGQNDYNIGYDVGGKFVAVDWEDSKHEANHTRSLLQDAYDDGRAYEKQINTKE